MPPQTSIRAGVIGFGYWGPNLARNLAACVSTELVAIADLDHERRAAARRAYPWIEVVSDADGLIERDDIDLIVIATPPKTHFKLAAAAVAAGKHVLVEKPFVTEVSQAEELVASAAAAGVHLFVDHTFLFTGAVRHIREDLLSLGDLLYYDATRTNLGTFQTGTDVLWDLAPHDFSILLSLVDQPLERIAAMGASHAASPGPTMAYVTLRFAGGLLAHLHLNWMAPAKVRRTIIGGSRKMLVYDDVEASEKLKVYDSATPDGMGAGEDMLRRMVDFRVGDIVSPRIDHTEALATEMTNIANVILSDEVPVSDAHLGLRVVRAIEAAQRSLAMDGTPVAVDF